MSGHRIISDDSFLFGEIVNVDFLNESEDYDMKFNNKYGYIDILDYSPRNRIIYEQCINKAIYFEHKDICGYIKILDCYRKNNDTYWKIEYNNNQYDVLCYTFTRGAIDDIVYKKDNYKHNIGDTIKDDYKNITITNRKVRYVGKQKRYCYRYKCNVCNFDFDKDYTSKDKRYVDFWIDEYDLKNHKCICCNNHIQVKGINDLATRAPWISQYFQGGVEESSNFYQNDRIKIYPICPICKTIHSRKISVSSLYQMHGFSCNKCSDGVSYPNKYIYSLLEQAKISFETEYTPKWSNNRRYDFYFDKTIIEAHGLQHYETTYFHNISDTTVSDSINNDLYKKEIAIENGIENYIEIDCSISDSDYIRKSIVESDLLNVLGIKEKQIDWNLCNEFASSSQVREICLYYNEHPQLKTLDIAKIFKKSKPTIIKFLKRGTEIGWCQYNPKEEMYRSAKENHQQGKPIICLENNYVFSHACHMERVSDVVFGKHLWACYMSKHISNTPRYSHIGGFHFAYISRDEFLKYKINSPETTFGELV